MLAVPLTDYYEEVRRYLTCPEEVKDDLIYDDVNRKVMDLNADRPDLDYDDVVDFLGDPEDLAQSLLDNIEEEAILAYQAHQKRSRLLRKVGIVAVIVALSISLLCLIALKTDVHVVRSDLLTTSSAVQLD